MPINLRCSCGAETSAKDEQEAMDLAQQHIDGVKAVEAAARLAAITAGRPPLPPAIEHTAVCTQTRTLFVLSKTAVERSKDNTTWHDYFESLKAEEIY